MFLKTLFEIPIYSMSQAEFGRWWDRKRKELHNECIRHDLSEKRAQEVVSTRYYPQWLWEYNQIIGYIRISVTKDDILFDIYGTLDKIIHKNSRTKHYIEDLSFTGLHFHTDNKSNDMIRSEILYWLKVIEKSYIQEKYRKRAYVDYSTFNNTFFHVNIREIIDDL